MNTKMKIIIACLDDFNRVREITQTTIKQVYPMYYPAGAVDFFLKHHSDEHIREDISVGKVYILKDADAVVGTVTISEDSINRLFVLPEYQHKGYGRALLDFAEKKGLESFDHVQIDASFPAKRIYKLRGYKEIEYNIIETENGDYLCYDVMRLERK
jgi:GNAT superfamily N-acetyltransferase